MAFAEKNAAYLITTAGKKKSLRGSDVSNTVTSVLGTGFNLSAESRCLKSKVAFELQGFNSILK